MHVGRAPAHMRMPSCLPDMGIAPDGRQAGPGCDAELYKISIRNLARAPAWPIYLWKSQPADNT